MADKKISQLPSGAPAQASDEYIVARSNANYKLTLSNIAASMPPIGVITPNTGAFTVVTATTGNITTVNATNVEATNIKAKDGTVSMTIANLTGNIGIGGSASTGIRMQIIGSLPVSSNQSTGMAVVGTLSSTATTGYVGFTSQPTTEAASFTATNMEHFLARPSAFGAGSSVTNQYGFRASSLMTGATNNFGFRSDINEAAGRWNFYTGGTAANYFAGSTGIGAPPNATDKLNIGGTLPSSSTNSFAVINRGVVPSATTGTVLGYSTSLATEAASFTVASLSHFRATQGTIGAGSAITNQFGFSVQSGLTGATNNYGFYSNLAAAADRWNFYAAGTARNYFEGGVEVVAGATTMTSGFTHIPSAAGAPTGAPTNPTGNVPMYYDATNHKIYVYSGGTWRSTAALT